MAPFASLLLLLLLRASALEQPFNVSEIYPDAVGRYHSLATDSPTSRVLRSSPVLRERVAEAYPFFDALWETVAERRRTNHSQACNLRYIYWVQSSLLNIRTEQTGRFDDKCQSRVDLAEDAAVGALDKKVAKGARRLVIDVKDALWVAQKDIEAIPKGENFTRGVFPLREWKLARVGQNCVVDNLFTYRVEGEWYVLASLANAPVGAFVPDFALGIVAEYVRKDLKYSLTRPWIKWGTEDEVEESTTFLSRWGGTLSLAHVTTMDFDDNPAVEEALRLTALAVDQAKDAVTVSNIAILALPMVMSLVPVAFIAELTGCAMLWYVIFTDVCAALPFLIKGVELIDAAKSGREAAVAYVMGNDTLGQMEVWAAECKGQDSFRVLGFVFVCIAVVVIVLGVGLEIWAHSFMKRKRMRREEGGPFGMALLDGGMDNPLEKESFEQREERLEREVEELEQRLEREEKDLGVAGVDERYEDFEDYEWEKRGWRRWLRGLIWREREDVAEIEQWREEAVGARSPDVSYDTGMQRDSVWPDFDDGLGKT